MWATNLFKQRGILIPIKADIQIVVTTAVCMHPFLLILESSSMHLGSLTHLFGTWQWMHGTNCPHQHQCPRARQALCFVHDVCNEVVGQAGRQGPLSWVRVAAAGDVKDLLQRHGSLCHAFRQDTGHLDKATPSVLSGRRPVGSLAALSNRASPVAKNSHIAKSTTICIYNSWGLRPWSALDAIRHQMKALSLNPSHLGSINSSLHGC